MQMTAHSLNSLLPHLESYLSGHSRSPLFSLDSILLTVFSSSASFVHLPPPLPISKRKEKKKKEKPSLQPGGFVLTEQDPLNACLDSES